MISIALAILSVSGIGGISAQSALQVMFGLASGYVGARIAKAQWNEEQRQVSAARARVAIRGLKEFIDDASIYSGRIAKFITYAKERGVDSQVVANLEELDGFCGRTQRMAAASIEAWSDSIGVESSVWRAQVEAELRRQLDELSAEKDAAIAASEANRGNAAASKAELAEIRSRFNQREAMLQYLLKVEHEATMKAAAAVADGVLQRREQKTLGELLAPEKKRSLDQFVPQMTHRPAARAVRGLTPDDPEGVDK